MIYVLHDRLTLELLEGVNLDTGALAELTGAGALAAGALAAGAVVAFLSPPFLRPPRPPLLVDVSFSTKNCCILMYLALPSVPENQSEAETAGSLANVSGKISAWYSSLCHKQRQIKIIYE